MNAEASLVCKRCDCPSTSHEIVDYEFVQVEVKKRPDFSDNKQFQDPLVNEQLEKLDKQIESILKSIRTMESEVTVTFYPKIL